MLLLRFTTATHNSSASAGKWFPWSMMQNYRFNRPRCSRVLVHVSMTPIYLLSTRSTTVVSIAVSYTSPSVRRVVIIASHRVTSTWQSSGTATCTSLSLIYLNNAWSKKAKLHSVSTVLLPEVQSSAIPMLLLRVSTLVFVLVVLSVYASLDLELYLFWHGKLYHLFR